MAALAVVSLLATLLAMITATTLVASADQPPGGEVQEFGNTYVLLDSTDPGGPVFDSPAYDPTTVATDLVGQDDDYLQIPLGFSFTFYGTAYANAYVSTNGHITFGTGNTDYDAADDPLSTNTDSEVPSAFGYWTDLDPDDNCEVDSPTPVTYDTFGTPGSRVFVAEWYSCPNDWGNNLPADYLQFQIRLFEGKNWIEYHYYDVVESEGPNSNGLYSIVGVRAGAAGSAYLQYSFDEAVIDNNMAIRIWQPKCNGVLADVVGTRGNDNLTSPLWGGGSTFGHLGNDTLNGSTFDDNLCGGDGVDTIYGDIGNDYISGGAGGDILNGDNGNDFIYGNAGGDTITGGQGIDYLYGAGGNDTLSGGPGNDYIYGQGQIDILNGEGGDDELFGGASPDTLNGGTGADTLNGGSGDDIMNGGADPDLMIGGAGNDMMNGGSGEDIMNGGGGNDTIEGFDDNDSINGGGGTDTLYGYGGDDVMTGGPGADYLNGGDGDDMMTGNGDNDQLLGATGADVLAGSGGDDTLSGGEGPDTAIGGPGMDTVNGGAGDDILYGNGDNDTLNGGSGVNELDGGGGTDSCLLGMQIRCE